MIGTLILAAIALWVIAELYTIHSKNQRKKGRR